MEKESVTLDPFFQVLKTKFPELTNLISNKGYILIAPAKSVITESELTLKFYYNHIYKVIEATHIVPYQLSKAPYIKRLTHCFNLAI